MQPYWQSDNGDTHLTIYQGDVLDVLRQLPDESVHCCITSPPYWGLRDYGVEGQIGLEPIPQEYVATMVRVFREVRRVLRHDGTMWLNLGDSYAANRGYQVPDNKHVDVGNHMPMRVPPGLKPKDLVGIPWLVAFALRDDGWYLRSDIIWAKPNPMPESVTDRPTKAHEYVFLFAKSPRYFYDADAIREPLSSTPEEYLRAGKSVRENHAFGSVGGRPLGKRSFATVPSGRNKRSVWTIATEPFPEAHFATFPTALVEPMVLAGCPAGGVVLDPFLGSGTTLLVAQRLGRSGIGIELNPDYCAMAQRRLEREHAQVRLPVGDVR